jgi:hypothetical protein
MVERSPRPNAMRDTVAFSRSSSGVKSPKFSRRSQENLGISGPEMGPVSESDDDMPTRDLEAVEPEPA